MNRSMRRKASKSPDGLSGPARFNFARALEHHIAGALAEACAAYTQALALRPDFTEAHFGLGVALQSMKQFDRAIACYRRAISHNPRYAPAFNNLSILLKEKGCLDEAEAAALKALEIEPASHIYLGNLGAVLLDRGALERATAAIESALEIEPDNASHLVILSCIRRSQGRLEEAIAAGRRVVAREPDAVGAQFNLAFALTENGDAEESFARFQHVARLRPDLPDVHFALAQALLRRGDLRQGWEEYEWRWRLRDYQWLQTLSIVQKPKWNGEDIADKTILICGEQGLGDTIQFLRFIPLVVARAKRVILWIQPALKPLFGKVEGVTLMGMDEGPSGFDVYCPLLSLPRVFGTTLQTVPPVLRRFEPDPKAVERWRPKLDPHCFRIGIAWQGKAGAQIDHGRSIALASFAPLARIPGVQLISLQKNFGIEQLSSLPDGMQVTTLGEDFDVGSGAFMDTAAVMSLLDLVVTSDSAIAHLAGTLSRPTWVALKRVPDWRWGVYSAHSPWYPAMRLFRQRVRGDWDGVFAEMAQAFEEPAQMLAS